MLLSDLYASEVEARAEEANVSELAKYRGAVLLPEWNVKAAMRIFDEAEAEVLPVVESLVTRKVIGVLTEAYARRRYVEELDQATRGILGQT